MSQATMGRRVGNLPAEVTNLVGRRTELAEAKRLLAAGRLVTLTGPGGVGKTRLALRVAADVRRAFPDGVWLVDLAAHDGAGSAERALGRVLGGGTGDEEALPALLRGGRSLLLLDNCEHLLGECAALAGDLLRWEPDLRVLATSRQALGVAGEHILDVPPMAVPGADAGPADAVAQCEAVRLFADRARAVVPGFAVCDANAAAVARLCRRLDGIPLAIELAALRTRVLSVHQILDRLDDRFRLLGRERPGVPPRQRTLRALVDWSHRLCSPDERTLWERMSVFAGGFDLEAAERVCAGDGVAPGAVLDATAGLLEKSVLRRDTHAGHARYRLPETFRQYGRDRLAEAGRERALRRRHRDRYLELAVRAEAEWFGGRQVEWLDRIAEERADLSAALDFCLDDPAEVSAGLTMAAALCGRPLPSGVAGDVHVWLRRALARAGGADAARAAASRADARLSLMLGDRSAAAPLVRECRAAAERPGDPARRAGAGHVAGLAALVEEDLPRAYGLLDTALAGYRAAGDAGGAWDALRHLATAAVLMGDARSAALCRESVSACERHDAAWSRTDALWVCGLDRWRRGDLRSATDLIRESLSAKPIRHDPLGAAHCAETLAWIAADQAGYERAARLLGVADSFWESAGALLPGLGHLARLRERCAARIRREHGAKEFAAAHARGRRLAPGDAVAYALDADTGTRAATAPAEAGVAAVLTRREREIAELVARGLSNKDIAGTLVIAQRTAEGHVERILSKLGYTSRTQVAAAWTAQRGRVGA